MEIAQYGKIELNELSSVASKASSRNSFETKKQNELLIYYPIVLKALSWAVDKSITQATYCTPSKRSTQFTDLRRMAG